MDRRAAWTACGLVALACAAYANSFRGPFVFDDVITIVRNPQLREPLSWHAFAADAAQSSTSGRPLVFLSFWLDYRVAGLARIWVYHATNLFFHVVAGLVLFGLARRLLRSDEKAGTADALAAAIAALFLVHPLQTEAVTYLTQRSEAMVGACYLLTLYGFCRSQGECRAAGTSGTSAGADREPGLPPTHGHPSKSWLAATLAACLAGMLCKEVMISAPLAVLLFDRAFFAGSVGGALRRRPRFYAALGLTTVPSLAGLLAGARRDSVGFGLGVSPPEYLRTQCGVLLHYARLVVWPAPLVLDYFWPLASRWQEVWPGAAFVLAYLSATAVALARSPRVGFVLAAAALVLAPSSSVVPIVTEVAAEHRMYLPIAAVAALAVVGTWRLLRGRRGGESILVVLIVVLSGAALATTWRRNADYRTAIGLWRQSVVAAPRNPRARYNLAESYADAGDLAAAAAEFARAVELEPRYDAARRRLATVLGRLGRWADAEREYGRILADDPLDAGASAGRGHARLEQGDLPGATADLYAAARLNPADARARMDLGTALQDRGDIPGAREQYAAAARLRPDWREPREKLDALDARPASAASTRP